MNPTLYKAKINSWRLYKDLAGEDSQEIHSLEDIPDFDSPEAEMSFWRSHCLSQQALDELPPDTDEDIM